MPQILFLHAQGARLFFNLNNGDRMFFIILIEGITIGILASVLYAEYTKSDSEHK